MMQRLKKELYFRVDMNQIIATGHVMRCLSIADELAENNVDSVFILADDNAKELINGRGYECIVLDSVWNDMDSEIDTMTDLIYNRRIENLLIDTYQITERYLRKIYGLTNTIYLDDLNMFLYPVHTLVCYANYWEKFRYESRYKRAIEDGTMDKMPQLYMGCCYAPLRREFRQKYNKKIKENIEEILIMSGGTDEHHAIKKILSNLNVEQYSTVNVICGQYNRDYDGMLQQYKENGRIHIYQAVDNINEFMKSADLAISAGGTTLYELCAVGTPTITYSIADNQIDNVMQFYADRIMSYVGDLRENSVIEINDMIRKYDCAERKRRSVAMQNLVDVRGKWYEIISN